MRRVGLGRDHDAGSVLVQPVHDPRPRHPAYAGETRAAVMDQRVDQGAGMAARRRMGRHAGRLVDDDQMGVFEEDDERKILALRLRGQGGGDDQPVGSGPGLGRRIGDRRFVPRDRAFEHQRLDARAGKVRQGVGQRPVEATGGGGEVDLDDFPPLYGEGGPRSGTGGEVLVIARFGGFHETSPPRTKRRFVSTLPIKGRE